ncbi:hypothetical protein X975_03467, partial [Stegodyphus mimosarum]
MRRLTVQDKTRIKKRYLMTDCQTCIEPNSIKLGLNPFFWG